MERQFLKESLFAGQTSNSFKLGTVLTGGWFWVRTGGCMLLYRGDDLSTVDFTNILAVDDADAERINVPSWLEHRAESSYLYVVRRANNCGMMEYGLQGLVFVWFDSEGRLGGPRPNRVFGLTARQVRADKAELGWYYCPLGQETSPACFKIYNDEGGGQMDFENEIGFVGYEGKGFYSFTVEGLNGGKKSFAVRAEDKTGAQDGSLTSTGFELNCAVPQTARIISTEAL
jgi:hypothetical protein